MICHVLTDIATNYPTVFTVNNKTLQHFIYPRAFSSPSHSSLQVNLHSVIGKSTLRPFWCFTVVSWDDLTQTALMKRLICFSPLMKPHTTDIHFIQYRWAFHKLLKKRSVENDCSAEEEVIPITLTWVSSSAAYLHTAECVNLISLLLFLSPPCFIFYFSSATHIHRDKKKKNHVQTR